MKLYKETDIYLKIVKKKSGFKIGEEKSLSRRCEEISLVFVQGESTNVGHIVLLHGDPSC